ncbi:MAG TPA: aminomethyl-transferring glycine dehydrogenase [Thermoanaerobaculia bacterium]|nr:aminomethyl-transferring glycine dehydrogenase [Thermoanaerobaculia bacterium]
MTTEPRLLDPTDPFVPRHIGPRQEAQREMLRFLGFDSLDGLIDAAVPRQIRSQRPLAIGRSRGEHETLAELRRLAAGNQVWRSFIGLGYHDCITPPVILRNVLENPGWYTQYTPYQAEIAQGRLEALLTFQTMVADLTGLPLANASLLDEATAAAEAMAMALAIAKGRRQAFFAADDCHPQTLAVLATRAEPLGIELRVGDPETAELAAADLCGVLLQYPATDGRLRDLRPLAARAHSGGAVVVVATDLLALALLTPPGEVGADIAVGSSQRFGVPLGLGGPHAAFLATTEDHARQIPGRIVGVSRDAQGNPAYRLALQTREQHIRREKATSNICTAQVLLAVVAAMYAVWHGPEGLRRIARRVHGATRLLAEGLRRLGLPPAQEAFFDTLKVPLTPQLADAVRAAAGERRLNLRRHDDGAVGVALDETVERRDLEAILASFAVAADGRAPATVEELEAELAGDLSLPAPFARTSSFLEQEVFQLYRGEHEMLRYLHRLQGRDLSLTHSMIPLGSCTMKLNATSEMLPISWPELAGIHPFAPAEQWRGYRDLCQQLEGWLADITGFAAVSLQPNAGSQGEYAGLLVIRAWHAGRGQRERDVCLIPTSAHGTNPASASMAGMRVVAVACDAGGNIDLGDLEAKAAAHADALAALMITYPSTHGVYEETVKDVCAIVHRHGGQVYLDGANLNALVGLARPAELGADVCHLNLHKTFCIPHGGGGPGMGPIGVAEHLAPFLPGHPLAEVGGEQGIGAVAAAPYGSPLILAISWMYIRMMGSAGLTRATEIAVLNANYMAKRLGAHYPILYTGKNGLVAHEFIVDMRGFKSAGVVVDDVAKRLMDYGFHAPTMSFPVAGTMMVEPTESESRAELDRFCDALIAIREEIREIEQGRADRHRNLLKGAPHTAAAIAADRWDHPYSRERAAFPAPWVREGKLWPAVGRIDNVFGDRNLICTCPSVEALAAAEG